MKEEWLRLKGVPSTWAVPMRLQKQVLKRPGVHVWSVLGSLVQHIVSSVSEVSQILEGQVAQRRKVLKASPVWEWRPPDLSVGSRWYKARIRRLREVIEGRPDEATLFTEGLELLRHHRKNYGRSGPKTLVVLWWEWPELHWNDLRLGGSMNFMRE
ncbi:MAG: hypothetical protein ACREBR_02680, partial [bacterium]